MKALTRMGGLVLCCLILAGCRVNTDPGVRLSGKIAYSSQREGEYEIIVVDPAGTVEYELSGPDLLNGLTSLYEPCLSADCSRLVAAGNVGGNSEIVLIELGAEPRAVNLTKSPFSEIAPVITPDGRRVIYASDSGGDLELYMIDLEDRTAEPQRLTRFRADETDPAITPNGRFVAYASNEPGAYDLYGLDLMGEEPLFRLTDEEGDTSNPNFSPDGRYLVYEVMREGFLDIGYVNFNSPEDHGYLIDESCATYSPSFSPDGQYICVVSDRDGQNDLCLYTWDGEFVRRITNDRYFEGDARWSPAPSAR